MSSLGKNLLSFGSNLIHTYIQFKVFTFQNDGADQEGKHNSSGVLQSSCWFFLIVSGLLMLFSRQGLFSERNYIRANLFGLRQEWRNNRNLKKKRDAWCYLSLVEHCFPFYHFFVSWSLHIVSMFIENLFDGFHFAMCPV